MFVDGPSVDPYRWGAFRRRCEHEIHADYGGTATSGKKWRPYGTARLSIQSILFENPYALLPFLIPAALVLVWTWDRRRTRLTERLAIGGIATIAILVVLQAVVVTDRERVRRVCEALAGALCDGDLRALATHVSDDFRIESGDRVWHKSDFLFHCEDTLSVWDIDEVRLRRFNISIDGDLATAKFQAVCRLISADIMVARHVSGWKIELVPAGESWRVRAVVPVRSRSLPYDSLADLPR